MVKNIFVTIRQAGEGGGFVLKRKDKKLSEETPKRHVIS